MKSSLKGVLVLVVLIFSAAAKLCSQDLKDDLKKCYNAYASIKDISTDIRVDIYKRDADMKPFMTLRGNIMKTGNNYYSHFEKNTILYNDKYMVYVDEASRYVCYKDLNTVKDKKKILENPYDPKSLEKSLDSALAHRDTVQYNGIVNGSKQYFITSRSMIYLLEISIDAHTNLITKLVYYYNKTLMKENNKVSVEFLNTKLAPVFPEEAFSERAYITVQGNNVTLNTKYKGYDLIKDEPHKKR